MGKTVAVRARIEPKLKHDAEKTFEALGLSTTQAIVLFYKQVTLRGGLPFDVAIPNATTRKTFNDTDADRNVVVCKDIDSMFEKLGI